MSWNYRIMRHKNAKGLPDYYKVHEVYFNGDEVNNPHSWSEFGVEVTGETPEEVILDAETMLKDIKKYPPLDYDAAKGRKKK